eukprot:6177674-Pleurochrysis_carterae.AAC.2
MPAGWTYSCQVCEDFLRSSLLPENHGTCPLSRAVRHDRTESDRGVIVSTPVFVVDFGVEGRSEVDLRRRLAPCREGNSSRKPPIVIAAAGAGVALCCAVQACSVAPLTCIERLRYHRRYRPFSIDKDAVRDVLLSKIALLSRINFRSCRYIFPFRYS